MAEDDYSGWIGRTENSNDVIHAEQARFMQATLGLTDPPLGDGDLLPHLWHWLYFRTAENRARLGRDGHPEKGGFLPPIDLPRRMWAGGRFEFNRPLTIGSTARKKTAIRGIKPKTGRSGRLCFVKVCHEYHDDDGRCFSEDHDIVYREDPVPGEAAPTPQPAPEEADFTDTITPDAVLLFRYSALMFNGHRIHYDRDYARNVEGYPDLVFHGPLTATLLVGLATRIAGTEPIRSFSFRAVSPLFVNSPFSINAARGNAGKLHLWAATPNGNLAVSAEAAIA